MENPLTQPVVCAIVVGRTSELTALRSLIDRMKGGSGQVLLLHGEAGIGKSRLVAEVKAYAVGQGFLLFQGNCFQGDHSTPYAPLLDLFRMQFLAASPRTSVLPDMQPLAQVLARLLPDLSLLIPDLAAPSALLSLDPEQEKHRLFAVVSRFFATQARQQPVLLFIEDLHWSDEVSLEIFLHLAHSCSNLPLLLVLTYRGDEVSPILTHFLAALEREHLAQELSLKRLSHDDVDAMLQAIFAAHHAVPVGLVESIYVLTEGNPFFIEEVLKSLLAMGELRSDDGVWERTLLLGTQSHHPRLPHSVRDAVYQRTRQLSQEAKQVLTLAAVAGRRFGFSLLKQILHCDESHMLLLVKELIAAQLVVEESEEQFSFRHALTRQAVYAELLVRERKSLHRTIAETIEQLSSSSILDAHLTDLAYHFSEGEAWSKALEYGQRAGERALALYAPRAALEHFTRAVQALSHLPDSPPATLYRARGQAYETLGEFELARADYQRALAIAQETHDATMESQSLLDLGFLWAERDYVQSGQWFQRALDLAQVLPDPELHAHSLNRLGNWLVNTGQAEEGVRIHQQALALFEAHHDTQGIAETLDLIGVGYGICGDRVRAVEQLGRAIALFRTLDDRAHLISSLPMHAFFASPWGSDTTYSICGGLEECSAGLAEASRLARQLDSLPGQAFIELASGAVFASFGELGTGLMRAQEALRIATNIQHTQWRTGAYLILGCSYLSLQEANLAIQALGTGLTVASDIGSAWWMGSLRAYLALAYLLKGAVLQAEAVLKAGIPREHAPRNWPESLMVWAWGEVALANGEPEVALHIAQNLLATAPGETSTQPIPQLLYVKGKVLLALQRGSEAVQVFEEAKRGALARTARPLLWQIHAALGRVYHHVEQKEHARREWSTAHTIIESLAATIDDAYLRDHFSRAALKSLPREGRLLARQANVEKFGGLTERERMVATLIAQGHINREIADALVVSERTVEAHVSKILSKLGFTSRRQIAALSLEKGLLKTQRD